MQGKRIALFGGSSGIGLALARRLAPANDVHIVSRKPDQGVGTPHVADLSREAAIAAVCEQLGPIDHLVYTAGEALALFPVKTLDVAAARAFFNVRYFGALTVAKHARVRESITLSGGVASERPGPGWAIGASICAGMEGLTRALAVELAPVRVNLIAPGLVDTALWSNFAASDRDAMFADTAAKLPVPHVGSADEVAAAYAAIMANTYITGQRLIVDGGHVLI